MSEREPFRANLLGVDRRSHSSAYVGPLDEPRESSLDTEAFTVFAAMPFAPEFDDVFFIAMVNAAKAMGGRAVRVDQLLHGDDAVLVTEREIRNSRAVIADLTTNEPDVLYELGLAHALQKPTVQICSTEYVELPFMVRNRETLLYKRGQIHLLSARLSTYLQQLLK